MKEYIIKAACLNPVYARTEYHYEDVLKRDEASNTPTAWVYGNYYFTTEGEALNYLEALADAHYQYEDEDGIEERRQDEQDVSWYNGEGYYDDDRRLMYQRGDKSLDFDCMVYTIEEL